ncbi:MAG: hypothetical protein WA906_03760 [Pacificimonas sp.]
MVMTEAFALPDWVAAQGVEAEDYALWLRRQATNIRNRNKKSWPEGAQIPARDAYMRKIHKEVVASHGRCHYSGQGIDWALVATRQPGVGGRKARRKCRAAPSIDHVNGPGNLDLKLCRDDVNVAKGYLTPADFVALCHAVVGTAAGLSGPQGK